MSEISIKCTTECLECGAQLNITNADINKIWHECPECGQEYESKKPGSDPAFPDEFSLERKESGEGENR